MGIFSRLNRVIKSNVNELIDKMSDPAKEVDQLIVEMEDGLKEAKSEVLAAAAEAKKAEQRCRGIEEELTKWQSRAEQAVQAGDDSLARAALQQRMAKEGELRQAEQATQQQRARVTELKTSLKALDSKLKDVRLRKETIKQRARAAKDGGSTGLAGGKAFDRFAQLESKIEAMEEVADLNISGDDRESATEAKFAQLERKHGDPEVEDELALLKRKLLESGTKGE